MNDQYYPWGGDFTTCSLHGCIAVVLLNIEYTPPLSVAIYGHLKTENIGIEKIIANVISNPHIRYLVICGEDIRGHRSGSSLRALHKNGVDQKHKIIDAPGVIPYIENLDQEAIERFQQQIEVVDCIGITTPSDIDTKISHLMAKSPPSFGEPYIAIRITPQHKTSLEDKRALHARIIVDYTGKISKRGA
jgi:tetrahydromethanopterin S-methyltransferase subunit A